jgi:hypothetical protein
METMYQTVDQSGISIPLEIARSFGLTEGTRIAISWQKDGIRVAAAEISAEEVENRALRFLLKHVGDAVGIGTLQRTATGQWLAPVLESATGQTIGQLCYTAAGELVPGQSTPVKDLLGVGNGA